MTATPPSSPTPAPVPADSQLRPILFRMHGWSENVPEHVVEAVMKATRALFAGGETVVVARPVTAHVPSAADQACANECYDRAHEAPAVIARHVALQHAALIAERDRLDNALVAMSRLHDEALAEARQLRMPIREYADNAWPRVVALFPGAVGKDMVDHVVDSVKALYAERDALLAQIADNHRAAAELFHAGNEKRIALDKMTAWKDNAYQTISDMREAAYSRAWAGGKNQDETIGQITQLRAYYEEMTDLNGPYFKAVQDLASEVARRESGEQLAEALKKTLDWIAARGWQPHGTTSENAALAYDCHCTAAQALSLTVGDFPPSATAEAAREAESTPKSPPSDTARLDWLDRHPFSVKPAPDGVWTREAGPGARLECSLRKAIDAVMAPPAARPGE